MKGTHFIHLEDPGIMFYITLAFQNPPVIPCKLGRCFWTPSQAFHTDPHVGYAWKTRVIYSIHPILGGGFKDFYFHAYFGKIPILTNIFKMG